ncbi:hypothetical protein CR513_60899, partial [Mucuna pruriens]
MKYPIVGQTARRYYEVSLKIRSQKANPERVGMAPRGNIHLIELDPRQTEEINHPQLADDLKEIQISQKPNKTIKIREEEQLIDFLRKNKDAFVWALEEIPRIDPNFIYHRLSIVLGARPIAQKKEDG